MHRIPSSCAFSRCVVYNMSHPGLVLSPRRSTFASSSSFTLVSPPLLQDAPKDATFYLSLIGIVACCALITLDAFTISTALPTIASELQAGDKYVWIAAAYGLAAASVLPITSRLADVFGRRPVMMMSILFACLGSALSGSAQNTDRLIAARGESRSIFGLLHSHFFPKAVQGLGGGGIISLSTVIISDLIPITECGTYDGIPAFVWALSAAIGPLLGGLLVERASWRWLFCESYFV